MMPPEELPLRAGLCAARLASRGPAPPPLLQALPCEPQPCRARPRAATTTSPWRGPGGGVPLDCAFQIVGRR